MIVVTTVAVMQEANVEWVHAVWAVMAISLLVNMGGNSIGLVYRKIGAIFVGLVLGIASGLIVLGLNAWDAPRWTIVFIRVVVSCGFLFGSACVARARPVLSELFGLMCAFSALPLYATSSSQAVARVVGVLFACFVAGGVSYLFANLKQYFLYRSKIAQILLDEGIFDDVFDLVVSAFSRRNTCAFIQKSSRIVHSINKPASREIEAVFTNLKPVVFDAQKVFWSAGSPSVQLENGIELCRTELRLLLCGSANTQHTLNRLVHEGVGFFFVEALQSLRNQNGASHQLGLLLQSLIVAMKTILESIGVGDKFPEVTSELVDYMKKIEAYTSYTSEASV